jgi:hypothetical protein
MNIRLRFLFCVLMITALIAGFVQIYFPPEQYNFERLHIFLFNLCTGCTILLYYTESSSKISGKISGTGMLFFAGSLVYALTAFLEIYQLTIALSVLLVVLVEKVRIKRFSFFPFAFFKTKEPVSEKFHQAALLCLSIGIIMAGLVIINNEYFNFVTLEKLTLNTFFLGFSFPLSLITFSIVFSMVKNRRQNNEDIYAVSRTIRGIMGICFWAITLGVISFFIFILSEQIVLQAIISIVLLCAIITVFLLYMKFVKASQQKTFLISGIGFLIFTALTGIGYIFYEMSGNYDPAGVKWFSHMHIFASLYGWNLCGLAVISRFQTFPVKIHLPAVIGLHWLVAIVLAPLGIFYGEFAILAVIVYGFIIAILFLR